MAALLAALLACLATTTAASDEADSSPPSEELLVFVQARSGSALSDAFDDEHLPRLHDAAASLELPLRVVDVADAGAPASVHLTPLIVFQDARGRSVFQGRYVEVGKLEHFVRTRRMLPPAEQTATAADAPSLRLGRVTVAAPLKITALAGTPPTDEGDAFDPAAFESGARRAVLDGFEHFDNRPEATLGASDRSFYMDFYPFRDADGGFFVTAALFSQFHCLDPVARWDEPFAGTWDERAAVFAEAARALEREVLRQIDESTLGDGFVPVPRPVPAPTWEELGLALPEASAEQPSRAVADLPLPARWRLGPSRDGAPPRLTFHFPPPFERYIGEVGSVRAALQLAPSDDGTLTWADADGWVEADTASVTMGETALDAAVHGKKLKVDDYPTARFTLRGIDDGAAPVRWGQPSQLTAEGTFELTGHTIDVPVRAEVEPVIDADGEPALRVRASFEIRLLEPFGIEGPPGPAPAADTLRFHLDFLMESATSTP